MEEKTLFESNNGLTGQSENRIDPFLLDFVKTRANSFVKWELMRFFDKNSYTANTAENIAKYLGRKLSTVRLALEDLVDNGILKRELMNSVPVYSLADDENTRALVDRFAVAFENRLFRIEAVRHIIPGMR